MKIYPTLILTSLLMFPASLLGIEISNNLETICKQSIADKLLRCDFRLISPEPVLGISATFNETSVPVIDQKNYPWEDAITAILFLVDTSDPARANVINKNQEYIRQLLDKTKSYHRIGLASFDKTLKLEVPIGLAKDQITNAVGNLRATGQTTELYRSVLSAIELLDKVDADRKSIFLFSDGLAEDTAYFHKDVVSAARKTGVIITSFGYPRSVSQSVALQTLRRLSEETGGMYVEADKNLNIPDHILNSPFETVDNGGSFVLDLQSLQLETDESNIVKLNIESDTGHYNKSIPLSVISLVVSDKNKVDVPVSETTGKSSETIPTQEIRVITKESSEKSTNLWFWYGIPIFLACILIITVLILIRVNLKQFKKQENTGSKISDFKPYAYLIVQDETKKRYAITRSTWRIGRSKDNEMILNDSSVSRRHAEIHRDKGDMFTIYDLDSMNGIYVNNNKISTQKLSEGDIIEIGDINLRFTLLSTDYSIEDATSMQNTRAPLTH